MWEILWLARGDEKRLMRSSGSSKIKINSWESVAVVVIVGEINSSSVYLHHLSRIGLEPLFLSHQPGIREGDHIYSVKLWQRGVWPNFHLFHSHLHPFHHHLITTPLLRVDLGHCHPPFTSPSPQQEVAPSWSREPKLIFSFISLCRGRLQWKSAIHLSISTMVQQAH